MFEYFGEKICISNIFSKVGILSNIRNFPSNLFFFLLWKATLSGIVHNTLTLAYFVAFNEYAICFRKSAKVTVPHSNCDDTATSYFLLILSFHCRICVHVVVGGIFRSLLVPFRNSG